MVEQKFTVDGIPNKVYNACPYLDDFNGIPFAGVYVTWSEGETYVSIDDYINNFKDGTWQLLKY